MTVWLRYRNLKERGIVNSWAQLKRLKELHDFPLGRLVSPNTRTWTEDEIDEWYASRPTAPGPARGAARTKQEKRRATAKAGTEAAT